MRHSGPFASVSPTFLTVTAQLLSHHTGALTMQFLVFLEWNENSLASVLLAIVVTALFFRLKECVTSEIFNEKILFFSSCYLLFIIFGNRKKATPSGLLTFQGHFSFVQRNVLRVRKKVFRCRERGASVRNWPRTSQQLSKLLHIRSVVVALFFVFG